MEIWIQKGGTNFSSLMWGKKRGESKFFQNPRGGTKALHTMAIFQQKTNKCSLGRQIDKGDYPRPVNAGGGKNRFTLTSK